MLPLIRRMSNVGSNESVFLNETTLQYWFDGPEGTSLTSSQSPDDLFQLDCSDATTGPHSAGVSDKA